MSSTSTSAAAAPPATVRVPISVVCQGTHAGECIWALTRTGGWKLTTAVDGSHGDASSGKAKGALFEYKLCIARESSMNSPNEWRWERIEGNRTMPLDNLDAGQVLVQFGSRASPPEICSHFPGPVLSSMRLALSASQRTAAGLAKDLEALRVEVRALRAAAEAAGASPQQEQPAAQPEAVDKRRADDAAAPRRREPAAAESAPPPPPPAAPSVPNGIGGAQQSRTTPRSPLPPPGPEEEAAEEGRGEEESAGEAAVAGLAERLWREIARGSRPSSRSSSLDSSSESLAPPARATSPPARPARPTLPPRRG
eukprot:tig00000808_g4407.t1